MSAVKKLMDVPYTEIKVDIENHDVDEIKAAIKALLWLMVECEDATEEDVEEICDDEACDLRIFLRNRGHT